MKKLRAKFWKQSKDLITWCCDEELRVLRDMTNKEMESRLNKFTAKFDQQEENRKQEGRQKARKKARGL